LMAINAHFYRKNSCKRAILIVENNHLERRRGYPAQ
jgi:hypothetical protein